MDGGGNGDGGGVAVPVMPVTGNGRGGHRPLCCSRHRRQHGGARGRRPTQVGKVAKPTVSLADCTPTLAPPSGGASRGCPARARRQVRGQWVVSRPRPPTDTCPQCRAAPRTRLRPGWAGWAVAAPAAGAGGPAGNTGGGRGGLPPRFVWPYSRPVRDTLSVYVAPTLWRHNIATWLWGKAMWRKKLRL